MVKLPPSKLSQDVRPATVAAPPAAQALAPVQPAQPRSFRDILALSGGWPSVKPQPPSAEAKPAERLSAKEEIERVRQMLKDDFLLVSNPIRRCA
jgi:hypothetical protein